MRGIDAAFRLTPGGHSGCQALRGIDAAFRLTPGGRPDFADPRLARMPAAAQIRTTRVALVAVALGAICLSPLALYAPWLLWLYALPLLAAARVLRAGADVDAAGVTVRALVGTRRVPWAEVAGLRVGRRGEVALVLTSGRALRLPTVRARHLPLIAVASGGRLPDPTRPSHPD